ncbi:MAG: hypothetical protein AB7T31_03960 [Gemmatimonadales bacterium]
MEQPRSDRDARVERMLDELDDVEAKIEELRPASRARTMVLVLALLVVTVVAVVAMLFVPGGWGLAPFLIAATAYSVVGLFAISRKNEELAELEAERARLIGGSGG